MKAYADTNRGCVRAENQDVFRLLEVPGGLLAVVCDGMGGHAGGRTAATLAADTFTAAFSRQYVGLKDGGRFTEHDIHRFFGNAVYEANNIVFERGVTDFALAGMGTTFTAVYVLAGHAFLCNIGDSRTYLVRDGQATRLTRDDSYVQGLIDAGELTEEEARVHEKRNLLTRALGTRPYTEFFFAEVPVKKGDRLLLVSDGFTCYYRDGEIGPLVAGKKTAAVLKTCIEGACECGGADNITVAVIDI